MGKRANPAIVGAFVVGAVVLAVAAVALFGSGRLFRTTYPYVVFFSGDVNGLNIGAPVKLKGVEIGSVSKILLNVGQDNIFQRSVDDIEEQGVRIPVIIELEEESLTSRGSALRPDPDTIHAMIERGLRAELSMESFVTGVLYVKLDIDPAAEKRMVGDPSVPYVEIPTRPTRFEEVERKAAMFLSRLDKLDVEGLIEALTETIDGINHLVNLPALTETVELMPETVRKLNTAVDEATLTLAEVRKIGANLGGDAKVAVASLTRTADRASEAMVAARTTLDSINEVLDPESPAFYQFSRSMEDMAAATRAIRRLAEDLERNPSTLLRGRATEETPK